jgi:hypothetical protein
MFKILILILLIQSVKNIYGEEVTKEVGNDSVQDSLFKK